MMNRIGALGLLLGVVVCPTVGAKVVESVEAFKEPTDVRHVIIHHRADEFSAWPANHGLWSWDSGREILLGFVTGPFVEQEGHKIGTSRRQRLARSRDSGETWTLLEPPGYVDFTRSPQPLAEPMDFTAPGLALRVAADFTSPPGLYRSIDRGAIWDGPFEFVGLDAMPEIESLRSLTPRTDYQILGPNEAMFFFSATSRSWEDRTFVIRTTDGGRSYSFLSWIVSPAEPYRAVMPQTVRLGREEFFTLIRRREPPNVEIETWIDGFRSIDGGKSWGPASRVAFTGFGNSNGNPPALIKLADGRLLTAYANRSLTMLLGRVSADGGRTWGDEIVLREGFLSEFAGFADFGYPRLAERPDGKVFVAYYFATDALPQQHIAGTIFSLDDLRDRTVTRSVHVR